MHEVISSKSLNTQHVINVCFLEFLLNPPDDSEWRHLAYRDY